MRQVWFVMLMAGALSISTQIAWGQEVQVQDPQAIEALLQVSANTAYIPAQVYFPCRVLLPADYDPARVYPLVIGLHGFGSDLDRFATLWYALDNPQFILAVPQAPYAIPPVEGGGASWLPKEDLETERWNEAAAWSQEYVLATAQGLWQTHPTSATYLLGFSQGGMLAYAIALTHPDLFEGVAGIGTVLPPDWVSDEELAAAKDERVFIAHSPTDEAISLTVASLTQARLSEAGLPVSYFEYEGGHSFTPEVLAKFAAWLKGD